METPGFIQASPGCIRFPNRFDGMIEEIRLHDSELEARFLRFFSDLERDSRVF